MVKSVVESSTRYYKMSHSIKIRVRQNLGCWKKPAGNFFNHEL